MDDNMFDVLIYLYENYMDDDGGEPVDQGSLEDELTSAGFTRGEVDTALRWLDELADSVQRPQYGEHSIGAARVYAEQECRKLDVEVRGLLLFLEHNAILDPLSRELVIERLLAIEQQPITLDEVKWVVLLVLMNRPGREDAFSQMEGMVYNETPVLLH